MGAQELHACESCPRSFATIKEFKCAETFFPLVTLINIFTIVDIRILILARISVTNAPKDSHLEVVLIATKEYTQPSARHGTVWHQIVNTKVRGKSIYKGTERPSTGNTMIYLVKSNRVKMEIMVCMMNPRTIRGMCCEGLRICWWQQTAATLPW